MPERDPHTEPPDRESGRRERTPDPEDRVGGDGLPGGAAEEAPAEHRRGRAGRVGRVIAWTLAALVGLLLIIVLILQTPWGREQVKVFALKRLNTLFDGAELTADKLSGNIVGRFTLVDVNLVKDDGEQLAHIDTLRAQYNIFHLLFNRLVLRDINLINPAVRMEQEPDGSWDLFNVIARDDSVSVDTVETYWTRLVIELDRGDIVNGRLDAVYYPPAADSVLRVRDLRLDLSESRLKGELAIDVNNFEARFQPPGQSYWAAAKVVGTLKDDVLQLATLRIVSPRSNVFARGTLRFPEEAADGEGVEVDYVSDIDFVLRADPLTFAEIRPFIPGLEAQGSADVELALKGSGRRLLVDGDVRFSDGGTFLAEGVVVPGGEGPVEYTLDVEARRLNPQTLLGPDVEPGLLNADLDVALQGTDLEQLTGRLNATVEQSRYGEIQVPRAVLTSRWEEGRSQFSLRAAANGAAFRASGAARPFAEIPTYDVEGQVQDLNLAAFLEDSELTTDLNGRFAVEGAGLSGDELRLQAEVNLAPSMVNRQQIESARGTFALADEAADYDVAVRVPAGHLEAEGGLTWRGEALRYTVRRGWAENFDVAALTGAEENSSFTGSFAGSGAGTDLATLNARFTASIARGFYGDIVIADAEAQGTLENGRLALAAEVDLENAGSFDVDLTTNLLDESPAYRFRRAVFRDVDLGALTDNPDLDTELNGSLVGTLSLAGSTPAFDGRIDLGPSRINEQQITDASLVADLNGGVTDFDLALATPEGQADLEGTVRPFLDVPSYVVRDARFSNVNLAAISGNPSLTSSLSGTGSFRGQGFTTETLVVEGRLNLDPSRINDQVINDAQLALSYRGGDLGFDGRIDLPGGNVRLDGTADLSAAVPTYRIREGSFQNLNIGAFTGNPDLQTSLTGTVALQGRGLDFATATASGRIDLQRSRINQQIITSASLTGDLRGGDLDFNLGLNLPEGEARLAGEADLGSEPFAYTVSEGTFTGLDLGALTNNPNLSTSLTGRIEQLEGRGLDPETADVTGRISLENSRINQQAITSASGTVRLDDGTLAYNVALDVPEGEARLEGTAQPFLERPTYAVEEGTFRNFNLGALLGREDLQTRLSGTATLRGQGFDPETMTLRADVDLGSSRINDAEVMDADVRLNLRGGQLYVNGDVVVPGGRAQLIGTVTPFAEEPGYDVAGTLVNVDVGAFLGADTLDALFNADFELRGQGFDPQTATIQGTIQGATSRFEEVRVDTLFADFRLDEGVLDLSSLLLRSNVADATAAGQLAIFDTTGTARSDLTFSAEIKDAEAIQPYLAAQGIEIGNGTIAGRAFGAGGVARIEADADLERLAFEGYRVSDLDGRVVAQIGPDGNFRIVQADATFAGASIPGLDVQATNIRIEYRGEDIIFSGDVTLDENRTVHVAGVAEMSSAARRILLEELVLNLQDDTWQLLQPAVITFGEQYRIETFLLYSGDQQIAIDGVLDPNGEQNLVVTIENFDLGAVADLLGFAGLDGQATGAVIMSGPAADPLANASLALQLASQGEDIGAGSLTLQYEDRQLDVNMALANEGGGSFTVNGFVPVNLSLAPSDSVEVQGAAVGQGVRLDAAEAGAASGVNLTIAADSFSIAWVQPFLDPDDYQNLNGILNAEILVTGTTENPLLAGGWRMTEGNLHLPVLGITLRDIDGNGTLANNTIRIDEATLRSGDGTAVAAGEVNLRRLTLGEFDIDLLLNNFRAADTEFYQNVIVDGRTHLEGTTQLPVVTGDVSVLGADIYVEEVIAPDIGRPELTEADLRALEDVFGFTPEADDTSTFALVEAAALDLDIQLERDTWVRQRTSPEMAIQVEGQLDVVKGAYSDMLVYGQLDMVPGRSYVEQLGRRFEVASGTLSFQGNPEAMYIDVDAEYRPRSRVAGDADVLITLNLEGQYPNLETTLGSEGGLLSQTDIISYIATGRPASNALQLSGIGTELALSQLTNVVENVAAEELGLDVVSVQFDPLRGTQVVAGEYVTHDLFVGVSQSLSALQGGEDAAGAENTATEVTVEYEIFDWLLLRMQAGQAASRATLRFGLQWEQAY